MKLAGGKPSTRKRRIPRASVLLVLGLPMLLVCAYLVEGFSNPKLFSKNYLKAEYAPILSWRRQLGHDAFKTDEGLLGAAAQAFPSVLQGIGSDQDIPELALDVKFKAMRSIYEQRDEALIRGRIVQDEDSFVKGKIRLQKGSTPVKIRLKGDFTDHLHGNKWSFRVHVRKGETFLGMRRFSVQAPSVRGYHSENLYFNMLKDYGVLTPRYLYVNMTLNGEDIGIMALEEHFSKELLESQSRREGPIVRYDENRVFSANDSPNGAHGFGGVFDDFRNAAADVFQGGKVVESPTLSGQANIAMGMLRAFGDRRITASEIFDAETLGAYLAVSELMGAFHAIRWHNQRFYMNPITMKMEPVAYDASLKQRESGDVYISSREPVVHQMLQDPKVFARYKEVLADLVARVDSGELISGLRDEEERLLEILNPEFILLPKYPLDEIERRAAFLNGLSDTELLAADYPTDTVENMSPFYRNAIQAFRISHDGQSWLEVTAATPYPVSVEALKTKAGMLIELPSMPIELAGRNLDDSSEFVRIPLPADFYDTDFSVSGRLEGRSYSVKVIDQANAVDVHPIPESDIDELLARFSFLSLAEDGNTIRIAPGSWEVPSVIALPEGYALQAGPGTSLYFAKDAALISRGNVFFDGTADAPVQLFPQAGVDSWLGFVAFAADKRSRWQHVQVQDTRGVQLGIWKLMGGTNFYRNSVDISDTSIMHHKGEDGLNIISSDFLTTNLQIVDTLSDGFDCDFCTGTIVGGLFEGVGTAGGGDAVDVSTSRIAIDGTHFLKVDDKAISVGEASQVEARNIKIESCGTGAAAKDGSRLDISDSTISKSRISALMSYIKKPEFGVAEVFASNLTLDDNRATAVVQTGSRVVLDGTDIEPEDIDVDELYETVMRPGLRRPKPEVKN
ncbi:MAG: CotH kinase family protein [Gammaproteobacteria bacterium]|nr:CotH kinase family protein [Gammaproteobacteria bacterium]